MTGTRRIATLHIALIAVHAAGGTVAFALGCLALALRPPHEGAPAAFRGYLGALWVMVLSLLLAVATDWGTLTAGVRILYAALVLLALYVGWRGWRAFQDLQRRGTGWRGVYVEDVGFTLIALFDGFVVIAALDSGAPVWLVVVIGVLGVLAGRAAIGWTKARLAA